MKKTFLKAEWRKLIMANYAVDQNLLKNYLPKHTEFDSWNDIDYISLVGFMFLNTSVKGIRFPYHINFEEVNLRFYVKHKSDSEWKRGVTFIKEIVPRPALTFVANTIYNEKYETLPMKHSWQSDNDSQNVAYNWSKQSRWNNFSVKASLNSYEINEGSEEEFITEHYWDYTKLNDYQTAEYQVEHPRWKVYDTLSYQIDVDFGKVYGPEFSFLTNEKPISVFLAEGSEINVRHGGRL